MPYADKKCKKAVVCKEISDKKWRKGKGRDQVNAYNRERIRFFRANGCWPKKKEVFEYVTDNEDPLSVIDAEKNKKYQIKETIDCVIQKISVKNKYINIIDFYGSARTLFCDNTIQSVREDLMFKKVRLSCVVTKTQEGEWVKTSVNGLSEINTSRRMY